MFLLNIFLYIISFLIIWLGAGLIISSISRFSRRLRLSSFAVSFVILGMLTSTPEFAVGLQSVSDHKPEIYVGNLLGGIPVIFLFIIPVLAVFGNGINLKHELGKKTLLAALSVILIPSFFVLDQKVSFAEGGIMIIIYAVLVYLVERKRGFFDEENEEMLNAKAYSAMDIIRVLVGIGFVLVSSSLIVSKTLYFAQTFGVSVFYVSLIAIAAGTNLPELSLAVRSVVTGKKDIAMGDYIGSAAANTLLFGIFVLLGDQEVVLGNSFFVTFWFTAAALVLFYIFSVTKNFISRFDGFILLCVYLLFVALAFMKQ